MALLAKPAPHVRLEVASVGWAHEDDLLDIVRSELPASLTFELVVAGRTIWPPLPEAFEREIEVRRGE